MQDKDAASMMPLSGTVNLLNGAAAYASQVPTFLRNEQFEGQHLPQRILVVEDDPTLATLEDGVLTAHGYRVVTVNSGECALAVLRLLIPDLVVLDLELNGNIHGWDVLQALRTSSNVPVILTTSATTAVRKHLRSNGETKLTLDHLPKPYPMQMLLKRVKRMLTTAPQ